MKPYFVNSAAGFRVEAGDPVKLGDADVKRFASSIEWKEKTKDGKTVAAPVLKGGAHVILKPILLKNGSELAADLESLSRAQQVLLVEDNGEGGRRRPKTAAAALGEAAQDSRAAIAGGAFDNEVKARAAQILGDKEQLEPEDLLDRAVLEWIADAEAAAEPSAA